jgi:tetratricopeptide (TPR) repeat protein
MITMSDSRILSVKPIIHYPRVAQVGKTYLMTIDLEVEAGAEWQYEEEEYPIYCTVDSELFSSKPVGEPVVVLHRFGGSYGEARFLLIADSEVKQGSLKIILINAWGVHFKVLNLDRIELIAERSGAQIAESSKPPRVFISYSHDSEEQMDQVLILANRLRAEGIDCSIDQYEQSPAKGWHRWMMDEIEGADFVLMIFTAKYIQHFWSKEEDAMAMGVAWEGAIITQDLYAQQGKNSKYIPILFSSENTDAIPKILRNTSRYDLRKSNGYERLYRRLTNQPENTKPELSILQKLPSNERKYIFNLPLERLDMKEKEHCNLPRGRYNNFVGRKQEILELLKRISPNYRQHVNVVAGIGGVGKTSLVIEVANRCWQAKKDGRIDDRIPIFDAIIFTSSKSADLVDTRFLHRPKKEPLLTDIFRAISDVLNEPVITQVEPEERPKKVNEILSKQSTLLIVDNMETFLEEEQNIILAFLNNVPISTQVIITTRHFLGFDGIVIESLNKSESFDLLDSQAKIKNIDNVNNVWKKAVYERFGGIPIALIYAIGKRAAGYRFADIIDSKRMLTKDLGKFCFESSVALIRGTEAYQLFMATPFFSGTFCRDALIKVAKLIDGRHLIDAFAKLQQLSLITEEKKGRYSILSITREYAISELATDENTEFREEARERWFNWYLDFTKLYGRQDWEGWRAKYDHLDEEWENIQSVLHWYAEKSKWNEVLQIWENIDNYADLSGYWQDRRYWWALLGKNHGSAITRVKALSEKGFILTLMGNYEDAEEYLNNAWDIHKEIDTVFQSTVANHLSILAKCKKDYPQAHKWLDIEADLLAECPPETKRKPRYQVRNLYYRAEINYLEGKKDIAKFEFEQVIESSRIIGWQRFKNYAKNSLAEIYIEQGNLEAAEAMIKAGLSTALQAREKRRVALYYASYARLYYQKAQKVKTGESQEEPKLCIDMAREFSVKALEVFSRELMADEINNINTLIEWINEY